MKCLSVCSGIEAASVAWNPLGWEAVGFSEIDPFACALLAHRFPNVRNYGDMTKYADWTVEPFDLLCGGTPCQAFSVAGLRKGLSDPRGNLALVFLGLASCFKPRWIMWENVPGVLSDKTGAFASFTGGLAQLGYHCAYRVLDAQFFGVPQRRRRVFLIGHLGDWRRAAAVLFEPDGVRGHPSPRREAGQTVAGTLSARTSAGGGLGTDFEIGGGLTCARMQAIGEYALDNQASTLRQRDYKSATDLVVQTCGTLCADTHPGGYSGQDAYTGRLVAHTLRGEGFDASEDGSGRGTPLIPVAFDCKASGQAGFGVGSIASTMRAMGHKDSHACGGGHLAVAFQSSQSGTREGYNHATLDAHNGSRRQNGVVVNAGVRRLTPRECERLQGFPDDWTLIPYRGKPAADGPRYRAIGNSWAVPVVRWIGQRMEFVDSIGRLSA
jgi:DNA (cytosine-5)-methyltransferase 1